MNTLKIKILFKKKSKQAKQKQRLDVSFYKAT